MRTDTRMIEVVSVVVRHSDALHDAARALVDDGCEGDDLFEVQSVEAERDRRTGGLGCVAVPPAIPRKPPSHLDRRQEMGIELRHGKTDEADEGPVIGYLDGPEAPAPVGNAHSSAL